LEESKEGDDVETQSRAIGGERKRLHFVMAKRVIKQTS
jgi:hypothetical protein